MRHLLPALRLSLLAGAALAGADALASSGTTAAAPGAAPPATSGASAQSPAPAATARQVAIRVTEAGFEPREITVKRGQPVTLTFTRVTDRTCITAVDIPDEGVKEFALPLNKAVALTITPARKGVEKFHCSAMGMGNGRLIVQD